jgi:hypothetical protein
MATTVTVRDKTAQALRDQAAARNMPLDDYLRELAEKSEKILGPIHASPHSLSQAEFEQWLRDVSAGVPDVPPLPEDFSRADIYNDHD